MEWSFEPYVRGTLLGEEIMAITVMLNDRHEHLAECNCEVGMSYEIVGGEIDMGDSGYELAYESIVRVLFGRASTTVVVERTLSNGGTDCACGEITYSFPELEEEVEAE